MKRRTFGTLVLSSLLLLANQVIAQSIQRIEPLHWWVGMKTNKIQLVVYGDAIGECTQVKISKPGIDLLSVHHADNKNYLFLDIHIGADAQAGQYPIEFYKGNKRAGSFSYQLKERDSNAVKAQGINSSDLIYLIMPDRFANGNPGNDIVKDMRETALNRDSMYYRHGGDLEGVVGKLDYLQDLGITSVWLTPVLTNDMPQASYHGYANTENYHIDPRFGTNADYKRLGDELHRRGMKLVHDVVPNHVGLYHWTVVDKPMTDWLHEWPEFTKTTYKDQTVFDPYASQDDRRKMEKGWFDTTMPDMNQTNPYVRNYITQSHIWWIEEAGIDGFRIDTYPYNDLQFMADWTQSIVDEYPDFTFFGETWVHSVPNQAYFLGGQQVGQSIDTKLMGVTDFQLNYAIGEALNKEMDWTGGVNKLYSVLAADYQYPHPECNVLFLDNHDKDRFFSVVEEDITKYKSAVAWLMTTRGIPQLYYGTEILMKNFSNPDGLLREDFKGGFSGDAVNKFEASGRTGDEQDMWRYVKTLANYRKNNPVLHTGKTMQFVPEDGIYVYFRYDDDKTIMVIMNTNKESKMIKTGRFAERIQNYKQAKNIMTDKVFNIHEDLSLQAKETMVLELF